MRFSKRRDRPEQPASTLTDETIQGIVARYEQRLKMIEWVCQRLNIPAVLHRMVKNLAWKAFWNAFRRYIEEPYL